MAKELNNAQRKSPRDLMICPVTHKQVRGDSWKRFSNPCVEVIWWHCPACQGWHIKMEKTRKQMNYAPQ